MNRRHVDEEAARQGDVAGDARALFAERLLGDLDDDLLASLQHFGNELGPARWTGMAPLITAVMPRPTWPPAFEPRSTAGSSAPIAPSATSTRAATASI